MKPKEKAKEWKIFAAEDCPNCGDKNFNELLQTKAIGQVLRIVIVPEEGTLCRCIDGRSGLCGKCCDPV